MGLIRKPKSKRVRIKDAERWRKKAKERKRKATRDAKRNPQWKSRVKKDPGVPNSFPFKDLILAEAEQARVLDLEEKTKAKELKMSDIAQLSGLTIVDPSRISTAAVIDDAASDDEEEAPALLDPDLPDLDAAINKADLVIQVLDSRDPLSYRVPSFEKTLAERGKKLIFVLNKTELVPREAVSAWLSHLRLEHPAFPFRPSTAFLTSIFVPVNPKGKERAPLDDELGATALRECITTLAKEKRAKGDSSAPFVVAFAGMANTGKSAIINSLLHEESQKVYRIRIGDDSNSRTTVHPRRLSSNSLSVGDGPEVTLVDTPGFTFKLPMDVTDETLADLRTKELLFHRRGLFEKMKNPVNAASWVLLRSNPDDLQVLYNTQAFDSSDLEAIIKSLGRASGRLSRSGKTDKNSTASMILRDWRQGRLGIYTFPPKSSLSTILNATTPTSSPFKDLYERTDSLVLDHIPTKAEMIAGPHGSSVVRFKVGEPWPENAQVDLHARYDVGGEGEELDALRLKKRLGNGDRMDVDEDSEEEDDEDELDDDDEMEDGEDQSDDDEEEAEWGGFGNNSDSASNEDQDSDSDSPSPPPKSKSKSSRRASANAPLEPTPLKASKSKKVAFASAHAAPSAPAPRSTKVSKPSKTSLKKATQEAAKERSRAAAAKSAASKPATKPSAPAEKKSSLKVTNEPSAARKKALTTAAASGDPSEQPYDFNLHFK